MCLFSMIICYAYLNLEPLRIPTTNFRCGRGLGQPPKIYHSIHTVQISNQDISETKKNCSKSFEIKNVLKLKTPNLQGFCVVPNRTKVRSF